MTSEIVWEIPDPLERCEVRLDKDTVTTLRRHGNPDGPRLVLTHGNGLAIDLYYPFWSRLTGEFDLIVYDLRNHGWNTVGPRQRHNIPILIRDQERIFEAIDRHYGNKPKTGVFHSVSALLALFLSPRNNSLAAQVLFDPPLCKPGISQPVFDAAVEHASQLTRMRGYRFETQEEFIEILRSVTIYTRVVPGVLELIARTLLRRSSNRQGYELRCPREYEAQIMDYIRSFSPLVDLKMLSCPTKVIGADPTLPFTYLPTTDLSDIIAVDYDFLPETTHYLQLEAPEQCVEITREFLKQNGLM